MQHANFTNKELEIINKAYAYAKRAKSINRYQPRCLSCTNKRINKWKSKKKQGKLLTPGQLLLFKVAI